MTYQLGKGTVGTLRTTDDQVPQEYREICYEETVNYYGDFSNEHFCLSLYYHAEASPAGHIEIEFAKEADFEKFKTRLTKAFLIRYEDSSEIEVEDDYYEFIGRSHCHDFVYEEEIITCADKMKVIRITIFDIDNQARKLIVEFETRRDRTNFINIFEKTSDVRLNDTSEINLGINLQRSVGIRYMEDHKWEKAIEAFNIVLGSNPEDAHALERRGIAYTYGEQYLRAIADFTDSIALDDSYEGTFSNRGYCYDQLQRYDEAITDYSRAIQIRPDTAMFYANRGESYLQKKEYESAISDFSKAIELDGEMTDNHNLRGEAFAQIGQYDKALADFYREFEVTPDDSRALANLDRVLQLVHESKGESK